MLPSKGICYAMYKRRHHFIRSRLFYEQKGDNFSSFWLDLRNKGKMYILYFWCRAYIFSCIQFTKEVQQFALGNYNLTNDRWIGLWKKTTLFSKQCPQICKVAQHWLSISFTVKCFICVLMQFWIRCLLLLHI